MVRGHNQDASLLLQHDRYLDVGVHVHVGRVVDGAGLQTQGDLGGVVGVDREVL